MSNISIDDVMFHYSRERARFKDAMAVVMDSCQVVVQDIGILASVKGRVKSPDSLRGKLERLLQNGDSRMSPDSTSLELLDSLNDLAGVRITTYVEFDRHRVVSALSEHFEGIVVERKDKPGGYRATHCITVLSPSSRWNETIDTRVEIQVCSMLSHVWNEIEHDIRYKEQHSWSEDLSSLRDGHLNQLQQIRDSGEHTIEELIALKAQVHAQSLVPEISSVVSSCFSMDESDTYILREFVRLGYLTAAQILETFFEPNWYEQASTWIDNVNRSFQEFDLPEELLMDDGGSDLLIAALLSRHSSDVVSLYGNMNRTQHRLVQIAVAVVDLGMDPGEFVRELDANTD